MAHELVLMVFSVTEKFPRTDQFGIVSGPALGFLGGCKYSRGVRQRNDKGVLEVATDCAGRA
jgi:hypothetical protein